MKTRGFRSFSKAVSKVTPFAPARQGGRGRVSLLEGAYYRVSTELAQWYVRPGVATEGRPHANSDSWSSR